MIGSGLIRNVKQYMTESDLIMDRMRKYNIALTLFFSPDMGLYSAQYRKQ